MFLLLRTLYSTQVNVFAVFGVVVVTMILTLFIRFGLLINLVRLHLDLNVGYFVFVARAQTELVEGRLDLALRLGLLDQLLKLLNTFRFVSLFALLQIKILHLLAELAAVVYQAVSFHRVLDKKFMSLFLD